MNLEKSIEARENVLLSLIAFIFLSFSITALSKAPLFEPVAPLSKLQYRQAADYSHLNWQLIPDQPVNIQILPIKNFSGIPLQLREEKADYFDHGKIPLESHLLFSDLVTASRYFLAHADKVKFLEMQTDSKHANNGPADYHFQLTIEQYQLPFDYAPDDIWWKELNANVDRWFANARNAKVKLSLTVSSASKHIANWSRTIETTLSNCDLNAKTQSLTSALNHNQTINQYLQTTTGQAFLAASNYLILQAMQYINQKPAMGRVIRNNQNEILIRSEGRSFVIGELLGLYYQQQTGSLSPLPAGQLQIVKSFENQATAYPLNLRVDQVKVGDWVELSEVYPFIAPQSVFSAKNHCAAVSLAKAG